MVDQVVFKAVFDLVKLRPRFGSLQLFIAGNTLAAAGACMAVDMTPVAFAAGVYSFPGSVLSLIDMLSICRAWARRNSAWAMET